MAMPVHLTVKLGTYLMKQKIKRVEKYPLIMELEPLFACNLNCAGCGKIQHPASILKQRMPVERAVAAVEECGAPMVSIAGGEPLMHPQIHVITEELLKRKKFVVLCTNAILLPKHIDKFKPNKNFAWMVHLDGIGEKHDEAAPLLRKALARRPAELPRRPLPLIPATRTMLVVGGELIRPRRRLSSCPVRAPES